MRFIWIGFILLALLSGTVFSGSDERALVLVRSKQHGTAARLLGTGIMVVRDIGPYLLAITDETGRGEMQERGIVFEILDKNIEGHTYYTADIRNEHLAQIAESRVDILKRHGRLIIFRASPQDAEPLAAEGIELARVFLSPMRPIPEIRPVPPPLPTQTDPVIEAIVDSVSIDRINTHVQRLQDFGTRYSSHDSCFAAANWIKLQFESSGIDSVFFHQWAARYHPNVVAVIPGSANPDKIVIIGGHYDSITSDIDNCPGADDNASGTACVLECAGILAQYDFDYTIVFIAFCAEEQGLIGSEAYASEAAARGDDIVGMIAVDMIGYVASNDQLDLDIIDNTSSTWLREHAMSVGALYVPELPVVHGTLTGGSSDHASFWRNGYDAIMFFEDSDQYSPYIHTIHDIVDYSYINHTLAEQSVKLAAALIADLARPLRVAINHTPLTHTSDETNPYLVSTNLISVEPLNPDSLFVRYSTGSGWQTAMLAPTATPDAYEALIPAQPGGTVIDYYIVAEDIIGIRATHPDDAPIDNHTFAVGTLTTVFADDFEIESGWTVGDAGDDATAGIWERVDPNATLESDIEIQPENDHTIDPGVMCFITGQSDPGASKSTNDVDDGATTLLSPSIDLSARPNAWVNYWRWYTNDAGGSPGLDYWAVDVSADSGETWVNLESTNISDASWTRVEHNLRDYVPLTSTMMFRFVASDEDPGSVVEAGVDDFEIVSYLESGASGIPGDTPQPAAVRLDQNFPNPFNPETTIRFNIPPPGDRVTLGIYDVRGRLINRLVDRENIVGERTVRWNGKDSRGSDVSSGVYFYRLRTGDQSFSKKLILLR